MDQRPTLETATSSDISLHALLGHPFPETLRLQGTMNNKDLTILIDGGSNHKFIQDRIFNVLGLSLLILIILRVWLEMVNVCILRGIVLTFPSVW